MNLYLVMNISESEVQYMVASSRDFPAFIEWYMEWVEKNGQKGNYGDAEFRVKSTTQRRCEIQIKPTFDVDRWFVCTELINCGELHEDEFFYVGREQ